MLNLTLNEMRVLKSCTEEALRNAPGKDCDLEVRSFPLLEKRWEIIEPVLKRLGLGSAFIGDKWHFNTKGQAEALLCRLEDEIADEERRQRNEDMAAKAARASYLSAVSALVSAACALFALVSRL